MARAHVCILSREDWDEWKAIAGDIADDTYEEYVLYNDKMIEDMRQQGHEVVKIKFDKKSFRSFCKERNLLCKTPKEIIAARSAWAGFQK